MATRALHPALARVLIVDDSAVARAVLSRLVEASGVCRVVASVDGPAKALALLETIAVDVILLDLEMPGIDGLSALPRLIAAGRGARVLVVSSTAADGAQATVQALALGAADTLVKPGTGGDTDRFADLLADKIARLCEPAEPVAMPRPARVAAGAYDVVAIGASTGGIHALSTVLRGLPASFDAPILITQHLPPAFSPYFAGQMAVVAERPCGIATDRSRLQRGAILVAPGDAHLFVVAPARGEPIVRLHRDPSPANCVPSVDIMLLSLAQIYGKRLLSIVLTGMGRDGLVGARAVRDAGGTIVVQDQASSVVWGMPGAIAREGLAHAVATPEAIGRLIGGTRRP